MAREVRVAIIGDPSSLQRALRTADSGVTQFGQRMTQFGSRMRSVGSSLSRNLTLPLVGFGILAARELGDSQRALAQTEAVIESTGGTARRSVEDITNLVDELAGMSGIDDEGIQDLANTLLTFRNIAGETFDQATLAALDLSVAFDKDLRSSAVLVGKALNDPMTGLSSLSRVGITFTQSQRDSIAAMVAFGNTAGAQALIMEELNAQVGGSAENFGKTLPGRLGKLKMKMEDLAAAILEDLMPALEDFADILSGVADAYDRLTPAQQKFVAGAVALAAVAGPLTSVLGGLATVVGALATAFGVTALAMASVAVLAVGVAAGLAWIVVNWDKVTEAASIAVSLMQTNIPGASQVITVLGWNIQAVIGFWRTAYTVTRKAIEVFVTIGQMTFGGLIGQLDAIVRTLERVVSLAQSARDVLGGIGDQIPSGVFAGGAVGANESAFIPSAGGSGGSSSSSSGSGVTVAVADEIGRAVARHLKTQPLMTVGVG